MTFERFSQLWNALVTDRPKIKNPIITQGCRKETIEALIEYGLGNKTKIESAKKFLEDNKI